MSSSQQLSYDCGRQWVTDQELSSEVVDTVLLGTWSQVKEQLMTWARQEAPLETCGLIIQAPANVSGEMWYRLYQLQNEAHDPLTSYKIDMGTVAELVSEETFFERCTVWHSHPGGAVGPGRGDCVVSQPGVKYLVVSLPGEEVFRYERCL